MDTVGVPGTYHLLYSVDLEHLPRHLPTRRSPSASAPAPMRPSLSSAAAGLRQPALRAALRCHRRRQGCGSLPCALRCHRRRQGCGSLPLGRPLATCSAASPAVLKYSQGRHACRRPAPLRGTAVFLLCVTYTLRNPLWRSERVSVSPSSRRAAPPPQPSRSSQGSDRLAIAPHPCFIQPLAKEEVGRTKPE